MDTSRQDRFFGSPLSPDSYRERGGGPACRQAGLPTGRLNRKLANAPLSHASMIT